MLSTPGSEFKLKDVSTREDAGHTYYTFIYEVVQNVRGAPLFDALADALAAPLAALAGAPS